MKAQKFMAEIVTRLIRLSFDKDEKTRGLVVPLLSALLTAKLLDDDMLQKVLLITMEVKSFFFLIVH